MTLPFGMPVPPAFNPLMFLQALLERQNQNPLRFESANPNAMLPGHVQGNQRTMPGTEGTSQGGFVGGVGPDSGVPSLPPMGDGSLAPGILPGGPTPFDPTIPGGAVLPQAPAAPGAPGADLLGLLGLMAPPPAPHQIGGRRQHRPTRISRESASRGRRTHNRRGR